MSKLYKEQLTDTELDIFVAFVEAHLFIKEKGLPLNAFDTKVRKKLSDKLGRNDLNIYVKKLKDKGYIALDKYDKYAIHPLFIPKGEDEIILKLKR
jgi:hypothetical protein